MTSKPPAEDLLDVVREFMERDLLPTLSAELWFQCKVAINVLRIVRRELEFGPGLQAAERQRLVQILGKEGSVDDLNRALCALIREGNIEDGSPALIGHLPATIAGALKVNNPKWID
jgi:hypothetical protein